MQKKKRKYIKIKNYAFRTGCKKYEKEKLKKNAFYYITPSMKRDEGKFKLVKAFVTH